MTSNMGLLCRDIIGGSLRIKNKEIIDSSGNLKVKNGTIKNLKVNGSLTVNGEDISGGGSSNSPARIEGNSYVMQSGDCTIIAGNVICFEQLGSDIATGDNNITIDMSFDGSTVVTGGYNYDGTAGSDTGVVRVHDWNGTAWIQRGTDIEGIAASERFGSGVTINGNGNTIASGARGGTQSVRVFDWSGSAWVQRGTDIGPAVYDDFEGQEISLSEDGNSIVIGDPNYSIGATNRGVVRVYDWNGVVWIQRGSNIEGEGAGDELGSTVDISANGNTILVGEQNGPENIGRVGIYDWSGSAWVLRGHHIVATEENLRTAAITSDGNTVVIGDDEAILGGGKTWVFDWNGTIWAQRGPSIDGFGDPNYQQQSGYHVAISEDGNRIVNASQSSDDDPSGGFSPRGIVRVYDWNGYTWSLKYTFRGDSGDSLGYGVAISKDGTRVAFNVFGPVVARVYCIAPDTLTLTLLDASENTGKYIHVRSNNNEVFSTENNIVHLFDDQTPTSTLMTINQYYVMLQSDGENWVAINEIPLPLP